MSQRDSKKSAIYDVFNHREKNELPETFPALLFVNCNLQASSWGKKDVGIQKNDYDIAVENNVAIVRIEDLVRFWEAMGAGKITLKDLIGAFTTQTGWLECKDNKLIVHK